MSRKTNLSDDPNPKKSKKAKKEEDDDDDGDKVKRQRKYPATDIHIKQSKLEEGFKKSSVDQNALNDQNRVYMRRVLFSSLAYEERKNRQTSNNSGDELQLTAEDFLKCIEPNPPTLMEGYQNTVMLTDNFFYSSSPETEYMKLSSPSSPVYSLETVKIAALIPSVISKEEKNLPLTIVLSRPVPEEEVTGMTQAILNFREVSSSDSMQEAVTATAYFLPGLPSKYLYLPCLPHDMILGFWSPQLQLKNGKIIESSESVILRLVDSCLLSDVYGLRLRVEQQQAIEEILRHSKNRWLIDEEVALLLLVGVAQDNSNLCTDTLLPMDPMLLDGQLFFFPSEFKTFDRLLYEKREDPPKKGKKSTQKDKNSTQFHWISPTICLRDDRRFSYVRSPSNPSHFLQRRNYMLFEVSGIDKINNEYIARDEMVYGWSLIHYRFEVPNEKYFNAPPTTTTTITIPPRNSSIPVNTNIVVDNDPMLSTSRRPPPHPFTSNNSSGILSVRPVNLDASVPVEVNNPLQPSGPRTNSSSTQLGLSLDQRFPDDSDDNVNHESHSEYTSSKNLTSFSAAIDQIASDDILSIREGFANGTQSQQDSFLCEEQPFERIIQSLKDQSKGVVKFFPIFIDVTASTSFKSLEYTCLQLLQNFRYIFQMQFPKLRNQGSSFAREIRHTIPLLIPVIDGTENENFPKILLKLQDVFKDITKAFEPASIAADVVEAAFAATTTTAETTTERPSSQPSSPPSSQPCSQPGRQPTTQPSSAAAAAKSVPLVNVVAECHFFSISLSGRKNQKLLDAQKELTDICEQFLTGKKVEFPSRGSRNPLHNDPTEEDGKSTVSAMTSEVDSTPIDLEKDGASVHLLAYRDSVVHYGFFPIVKRFSYGSHHSQLWFFRQCEELNGKIDYFFMTTAGTGFKNDCLCELWNGLVKSSELIAVTARERLNTPNSYFTPCEVNGKSLGCFSCSSCSSTHERSRTNRHLARSATCWRCWLSFFLSTACMQAFEYEVTSTIRSSMFNLIEARPSLPRGCVMFRWADFRKCGLYERYKKALYYEDEDEDWEEEDEATTANEDNHTNLHHRQGADEEKAAEQTTEVPTPRDNRQVARHRRSSFLKELLQSNIQLANERLLAFVTVFGSSKGTKWIEGATFYQFPFINTNDLLISRRDSLIGNISSLFYLFEDHASEEIQSGIFEQKHFKFFTIYIWFLQFYDILILFIAPAIFGGFFYFAIDYLTCHPHHSNINLNHDDSDDGGFLGYSSITCGKASYYGMMIYFICFFLWCLLSFFMKRIPNGIIALYLIGNCLAMIWIYIALFEFFVLNNAQRQLTTVFGILMILLVLTPFCLSPLFSWYSTALYFLFIPWFLLLFSFQFVFIPAYAMARLWDISSFSPATSLGVFMSREGLKQSKYLTMGWLLVYVGVNLIVGHATAHITSYEDPVVLIYLFLIFGSLLWQFFWTIFYKLFVWGKRYLIYLCYPVRYHPPEKIPHPSLPNIPFPVTSSTRRPIAPFAGKKLLDTQGSSNDKVAGLETFSMTSGIANGIPQKQPANPKPTPTPSRHSSENTQSFN